MRFLNFLSELDVEICNELQQLNNFIEQAIKDDQFITEACLPLLNGGKRLRPLLFFTCAKSNNNCSLERLLPLATAIELIHTASLVHDDILDQSSVRRGISTANASYGAQIAVLIGDYLFAKAFQLVAENNYGDEVSLTLSRLVKNLCIGEITQDRSLFQVPTITEYYKKIRLKTAEFLSTCCRLGGIVAGLDRREIEALTIYGTDLGLAFQIVDDWLDFFGDVDITGKALGGDLKSGVVTLPVIRALDVSIQSAFLFEIVTSGFVSDLDVITAIDIIRETDAANYCKTRAFAHIDSARINLPDMQNTSTKISLEKIADFVVDRSW